MPIFSSVRNLTLGISFILSITTTVAQGGTGVSAISQLNYYYDGGCSAYDGNVKSPSYDTLQNYAVDGSNSVNIADCSAPGGCSCSFWTEPDAGGRQVDVNIDGNNCASNWGGGFQSYQCHADWK
jgi:hypothetical protein